MPQSSNACRQEIEAAIGRPLLPKEFAAIGKQAAKIKGKIDLVGGGSTQARTILQAFLDQREVERAAKKAASAASAAAFMQKMARWEGIGSFATKNPVEAARGLMVSSEKNYSGAKDSLGINLDRAGAGSMQTFIAALHKVGLADYAFDKSDEKNIRFARAALERGEDPSKYGKNAVTVAGIIKKFQDQQLAKMREAGIAKGKIEDYTGAQHHDPYALARAGDNAYGSDASFNKWATDINPRMNWNDSFGGELAGATPAEKAARLRSVWNQFVAGAHLQWSDALKAIKSREIIFKTTQDEHDYAQQYGGNRGYTESVWHQVGRAARQITTAQEWGPDAEANIRKFYDEIERRVSEQNDTVMSAKFAKMKAKVFNNYMPSYLGQLNSPAHGATNWLTQLRGFLSAAKVGASLPTLFMDVGQSAAQLDRFGARSTGAFFKGLYDTTGRMFDQVSKQDKIQAAARAGVLLQGAGLPISEASREYAGPGIAGRLALGLMKHGGHNFWTDKMRVNVAAYHGMIDWANRGKAFEQLEPGRQALLSMFGLGPKEWDVMRTMEGHETPFGQNAFQPADIQDMPKEKFASLAPEGASDKQLYNAREDVFRKYRNMIGELADRATVSPSAEMRAVLAMGTHAGTPIGEVVRSFGELKGFLYNYMKNHFYGGLVGADADPHNVGWGQAMWKMATGRGGSAYGRMARLVATMVGLAYIKNTIQDVAAGKTPENPTGDHWSDAMLRAFGGGALGPMSDLLTSQTYLSADAKWPDYVGALAGPTIETAGDMGTAFLSMAKHGAKYATQEGYDSDKFFNDMGVDTSHLASSAYRSVPYNNLLWTKWATDYLFYDNLMDLMNPGYKDRMRNRLQEERGQSLILDGGQ